MCMCIHIVRQEIEILTRTTKNEEEKNISEKSIRSYISFHATCGVLPEGHGWEMSVSGWTAARLMYVCVCVCVCECEYESNGEGYILD